MSTTQVPIVGQYDLTTGTLTGIVNPGSSIVSQLGANTSFANVAALATAIAAPPASWTNGLQLDVATDPVGVSRAWNSTLGNARAVYYGANLIATLGADTNVVTSTVGSPSVTGNAGDLAIDVTNGITYLNLAGTSWKAFSVLNPAAKKFDDFALSPQSAYQWYPMADYGPTVTLGTAVYDKVTTPGGTIAYKIRPGTVFNSNMIQTGVAYDSVTTLQPICELEITPGAALNGETISLNYTINAPSTFGSNVTLHIQFTSSVFGIPVSDMFRASTATPSITAATSLTGTLTLASVKDKSAMNITDTGAFGFATTTVNSVTYQINERDLNLLGPIKVVMYAQWSTAANAGGVITGSMQAVVNTQVAGGSSTTTYLEPIDRPLLNNYWWNTPSGTGEILQASTDVETACWLQTTVGASPIQVYAGTSYSGWQSSLSNKMKKWTVARGSSNIGHWPFSVPVDHYTNSAPVYVIYLPTPDGISPGAGADLNIAMYSPDRRFFYEGNYATYTASTDSWNVAGPFTVWDLTSGAYPSIVSRNELPNTGYASQIQVGTRAGGGPLFPGMVTGKEIGSLQIYHALAIIPDRTRQKSIPPISISQASTNPIVVVAGGTGYKVGDVQVINGGTTTAVGSQPGGGYPVPALYAGSPAKITVTQVGAGGVVQKCRVTNTGSYTSSGAPVGTTGTPNTPTYLPSQITAGTNGGSGLQVAFTTVVGDIYGPQGCRVYPASSTDGQDNALNYNGSLPLGTKLRIPTSTSVGAIFKGTISGGVLTVSSIVNTLGKIQTGQAIQGTTITGQTDGTTGGVGHYTVASTTVSVPTVPVTGDPILFSTGIGMNSAEGVAFALAYQVYGGYDVDTGLGLINVIMLYDTNSVTYTQMKAVTGYVGAPFYNYPNLTKISNLLRVSENNTPEAVGGPGARIGVAGDNGCYRFD